MRATRSPFFRVSRETRKTGGDDHATWITVVILELIHAFRESTRSSFSPTREKKKKKKREFLSRARGVVRLRGRNDEARARKTLFFFFFAFFSRVKKERGRLAFIRFSPKTDVRARREVSLRAKTRNRKHPFRAQKTQTKKKVIHDNRANRDGLFRADDGSFEFPPYQLSTVG